jgi:hypothetical protein
MTGLQLIAGMGVLLFLKKGQKIRSDPDVYRDCNPVKKESLE